MVVQTLRPEKLFSIQTCYTDPSHPSSVCFRSTSTPTELFLAIVEHPAVSTIQRFSTVQRSGARRTVISLINASGAEIQPSNASRTVHRFDMGRLVTFGFVVFFVVATTICHHALAQTSPVATTAATSLATQPSKSLRAGASAVDITPQHLPVETAGSMTPHSTSKVHDPLMARCLVLDNGESKVALVVCDSCMIPREVIDPAREQAAKATGIPATNIICSATHSHSAVCVARVFQSNVDVAYSQYLTKKIVQAITQAYQQLEVARIGWAVGSNPSQVFNRRWHLRPGTKIDDPFDLGTDKVRMNPAANQPNLLKPAGPVDPGVPVLAVQAKESGRPIAVWSNYSLHYVGGIPEGGLSGDYYGEFSRQLTKLIAAENNSPPTVVAMTNGTSGDINNINFYEGPPQGRKPFEQIQYVAADLAKTALNAYQRVQYLDWIPISAASQEIDLGVRKPTVDELSRAKDLIAAAGNPPWNDRRLIYANETVHMAEYADTVRANLVAMRIGDLGIVSTPCETFVETGLAIKQESPLPITFVIELANGYNGYLPTVQQHALGGYETWRAKSSYLAVDAEPKVRSALLKMLDQVASNPAAPAASGARLQPNAGDSPVQRVSKTASSGSTPEKKTTDLVAASDALRTIESTRGGRHWVDDPTDPPKSPEASLACFQIEPGLKIELVAAEPLVIDPVWIQFDEFGRMFVAEYSDYPIGPAGKNDGVADGQPKSDEKLAPLSKIVMLEDIDGDGKMDRRTVFADKLDFVHSFMPFRGGLLVGAKTEILFLRDTDGDNKADVRETLFTGFKPAHPQMQIGCPVWGIDNWIYWTYGAGEIQRLNSSMAKSSDQPLSLRRDFRLNPINLDFGASSGFGQFGHTIDSTGNRFFCTNRNPIIAAPLLPQELQRNAQIVLSQDQYDVAPSGGDSLVYPLIEMKSNYLSHAGTHTAACGTTAYVGDLLGPQFVDSVMVCEPIGHLITRTIIKPNGSILSGERARPKADFLASTDRWFRPASLATGPDGALYVADMYRLWVEHPKFLPPEIAAKLDWRAGDDRGRIWRIVPESHSKAKSDFKHPETTADLVKLLQHPNGWRRELGQRLLVERQAAQAEEQLRNLLKLDDRWASHRALWTLDGIGRLSTNDVRQAVQSKHANVRQAGVSLAAKFIKDRSLQATIADLASDSAASVRMQVALTLGAFQPELASSERTNTLSNEAEFHKKVAEKLALILSIDPNDSWTVAAILSATAHNGLATLNCMVDRIQRGDIRATAQVVRVVRELSMSIGASGEPESLGKLLDLVGGAASSESHWWRYAALNGLSAGLPKHKTKLIPNTLSNLLTDPPAELSRSAKSAQELLEAAANVALNREAGEADRLSAIEMLANLPKDRWDAGAEQLLSLDQPASVQLATLQQMRRLSNAKNARLVIDRWSELGPQVRQEAIGFLLQRKDSTILTLQAMQQGKVSPAVINIDQRAILLAHADAEIKQLAVDIFGSGISADRLSVAQQYQASLQLTGNGQSGKAVFEKVCAACHRFNGLGNEVGPDISDTRNRSREALLYDILDPNQKLEPKYTAYQVVTVDGAAYQGLLQSESAQSIVLQLAEGKQVSLARSQIELFRASGKSLMPEGVEKEVSVQQMADLLQFLKQ